MLYHYLYSLRDLWFGFNVFRYITFRAAFSAVMAFLLTLLIAPFIIRMLENFNIKEKVLRKEAPSIYEYHKHKEGTPTMGGIIIISAIVFSTLLWADLANGFIQLALLSIVCFGILGFIDDYIKAKGFSRGLMVASKLFGQIVIATVIGLILFADKDFQNTVNLPFFKNLVLDLGIIYVLFVVVVVVASSNAVNITDGLDGLAVGCMATIAFTFAIISYVTGHANVSEYLNIFFHPNAGELAVFCMAIVGSCLGFLWYNAYPASIFMGDTGSLALGGAIGVVAVFVKKELLLFIVGGIFVFETLTVLLQVFSYKVRKKRLFLMAPIHHHLQLKGWPENKIIIRFWIIAIVLSLLTLATLKLR
ncbi:MAG: phospho-N-acetylmuramoyl-pentapeptide-transferase [Candidatus Omnitrophota bacterium]